MEIATIGFTRSSAERFFGRISSAACTRIIDIRLNNTSQLAGFAKRADLEYFARHLCAADYAHVSELAPEEQLLRAYRTKELDWSEYAAGYLGLLQSRRVEATLSPSMFDGSVLLCTEQTADRCHRRLAAEYLQSHWPDVTIRHL